jgi:hypothetical protein
MSDTGNNLPQKILNKAIKDNAFRDNLKNNPKETIENELGVKLPSNLKVHVYERGPNEIHLSLPPVKNELTDEQLSGVSGAGWSDGGGHDSHVGF